MQLHTEFDNCALNTHKRELNSASPEQPIGIGLLFVKFKPCLCGVRYLNGNYQVFPAEYMFLLLIRKYGVFKGKEFTCKKVTVTDRAF